MTDPSSIPEHITLAQLTTEHPTRARWKNVIENYRLLYRGGDQFLRAAGQQVNARSPQDAMAALSPSAQGMGQRIPRRFLWQFDGETLTKYNARWEQAHANLYIGPAVDYFVHWLFSQPPEVRPCNEGGDKESLEVPDWWEEFSEDCTGGGMSLVDFVRDAFRDSLQAKYTGWLLGKPAADVGAMSQGDAEDADMDGVCITPYSFEEIIDWQKDDAGELEWIVLCKETDVRAFPDPRRHVKVYTVINRAEWKAWEATPPGDGTSNEEIPPRLVGSGAHGLGKVPFVWMEVPEGLWIVNKLAAWQIDLFNKMALLSYGQRVSCYLQPYIKSGEEGAENRIFGEGYLLKLRSGMGDREAEEFGWAVPDVAPLEFTAKQIIEQRDEGFRNIHQMSLAVDSQAVGAIARSGVSKVEDRRASEIILAGYGGYVRDAIIRTANLISEIQGDDSDWECVGFDSFAVSSLEEELQTAALVQTFDLKSPTFDKALRKSIANRVLGHIDEGTRQQIESEINDAVDEAQEQDSIGTVPNEAPIGAAGGQPGSPDVKPPKPGLVEQPPAPPGPPIKKDKVK
jgi:hypothetical protein